MTELLVCMFLAGVAVGALGSAVLVARPLRKQNRRLTGRWVRAVERHDLAKQVIARMVEEEAKGRRLPVVA